MSRVAALSAAIVVTTMVASWPLFASLAAATGVEAGVAATGVNGASAAIVRVAESGQRGTPFRGIAIGDDKKQVNIALGELGLRCMTKSEKDLLAQQEIPLLETIAGLDACRVINQNANVRGGNEWAIYFDAIITRELIQRTLLYAIIFEDGVVSAMYLPPSFFNAATLDGWSFARSIAESYMQFGSVQSTDHGIMGRSPAGDLVRVGVSPNGRQAILAVERATAENTPSFN